MNALFQRAMVPRLLLLLAVLGPRMAPGAEPLTALDFRIVGSRLRVTPERITVPRNVAASVLIQVVRGDGAVVPPAEAGLTGGRVEAILRGPSFPAQRLVAEPGEPLYLPPLRLAGDYQLDDVKWVQAGGAVLRATPDSIPVRVIDEILVSRVTSRPLSSEEIREKGIVIDHTNFRVVEFDVVLVLRGRSFRVNLPVVAPRVRLATEIIPVAELEERTVEAERLNQELTRNVELPPEIKVEMPDFSLQPIQFEEVLDGDGEEKGGIPITGLLAIPGNIGFLNQFFSVQLFTENAAPEGSGLSVDQVRARIRLPAGSDGLPARTYEQPGDDPLRLARVGADPRQETNQPVVLPGTDGKTGTDDDVSRLLPGEAGTAEFLVEGLREGLHVIELDLEADLYGLAAGVARVRGRAVGSVLVRNANFSMTFSHPQTVRTGEPYEAHVTLLNTGEVPANATRVSLNKLAISGAVLLGEETVELGDLMPGESGTATFRLRSQRTGSVFFSNLTTSDDAVRGRLNLTLGVDSRGVPLSPDVIVYPDWVYALPKTVFDAANRVLGQALGVATAGRLPDGIRRVARDAVARHGTELAEAGQRLRYGDDPSRVLVDLLLDWQGARVLDPGFDQIVRESDAGREWRDAIVSALEAQDAADAPARFTTLSPGLAGLGQSWWIATAPRGGWSVSLLRPDQTAGATNDRPIEQAAAYRGARGSFAVTSTNAPGAFEWTAPAAGSGAALGFLRVQADGRVERLSWTLGSVTAGERFRFEPVGESGLRRLSASQSPPLQPERETIPEERPRVLAALQDISVVSDRASMRCPIREYGNWGTVVALLFNKPMRASDVERPEWYAFDDSDNGPRTVQLQPGGRVALLQLHRGIGSFAVRPRDYSLGVGAVPDPRGNAAEPARLNVAMAAGKGTSVRGLVLGLDGNPVAGAPVTLTMIDREGARCLPAEYRAGQVFTDDRGRFALDFVLSDVAFTLAAIDTSRMTDSDARAILAVLVEASRPGSDLRERVASLLEETEVREAMLRAFQAGEIGEAIAAAEGVDRATYSDLVSQGDARAGSELVVVLRFRGRGSVEGRVLAENGAPIAGAAVNLFPAVDSRELGRGLFADDQGYFHFEGVPLGELSLEAGTGDGRTRTISARLENPGQRLRLDVTVPEVRQPVGGVSGWASEVDGAPHAAARVYVAGQIRGAVAERVIAAAAADADGAFRMEGIPEGTWNVIAISADGSRRSEIREVRVTSGSEVTLRLQFEPTAVIRGVVRLWDGTPAARARVGGGSRVVETDASGRFELPGVPTGARNLIAGLDGPDTPDGITRTASLQLVVRPGISDSIEIRLPARARIRGVVFDGSGVRRVGNVRVAIPQPQGFYWVMANANGEYEFNGLGLGGYLVSAPAPPVKPKADELAADALAAIGDARGGGSLDEAAALVGQLANLYAQGSLGRLVTTPFTPASWGFNTTSLDYDGQTVVANVRYLPSARLSGVVVNHQEVPVGASVTVRAFGPTKTGGAGMIDIGPFTSDPSSGQWSASGFLTGPYTVEARSPLLVGAASVTGTLTPDEPARTNLVIRFPAQREVTGRLTGLVLDAEGMSVSNAAVHINLSEDYVIATDAEGRFDTQLRLPARHYHATATNLTDGAVGDVSFYLVGGITNFVTLRLLDRGAARVLVVHADGRPARNAVVTMGRYAFPGSEGESGITGGDGLLLLEGLWEGDWTVAAEALQSAAKTRGLAAVAIERGRTNDVRVVLGATASLAGTFVEAGSGRPIHGSQVAVRFGNSRGPIAATAPTGPTGAFEVTGLPLGSYFVSARHAVNGRIGTAAATLSSADGRVMVELVEAALGDLAGVVTRDGEPGGQPGVEVTFRDELGLSPELRVTTGPSGEFAFPGVPIGRFHLGAADQRRRLTAAARGDFARGATSARLDLALPGLGSLDILVLEADGRTPATNATVSTGSGPGTVIADTDEMGHARLGGVGLGSASVTVASRRPGESASVIATNLLVSVAGQTVAAVVRLPGVGRIAGRVLNAAGQPVSTARIDYRSASAPGGTRQAVTGSDGLFVLEDLPLSDWTLLGTSGALAAHAGGRLTTAGQSVSVELRLGASGGIRGVVQDAAGNELRDFEVAFFFESQAGQPAFARAIANGVGAFEVGGLPVGRPIRLRVEVPALDGIRTLVTNVATGGAVVDVGVLRLDQSPPLLVDAQPAPGSANVVPRPTLRLEFSEPLRRASIRTNGLVLRSRERVVAVDFVLEHGPAGPDSRLAVIPHGDLDSAATCTLWIAGADQVDAGGRPVSLGPEDLEGRPLPRTELYSFTVRDFGPPRLVTVSPSPGERDVEPMAAVRWEFDEPIRTNGLTAELSLDGAAVPAEVALNANGRVLGLVPSSALLPNRTYRVQVSGVRDLAGNLAPEGVTEFSTLDTRGPSLAVVRLRSGQRPVSNATVTLEAVMDPPEPEAVVRWTRNGVELGLSTTGPIHSFPIRLPAEGTVRITAVGVDRAGNPGEAVVLEFQVGPNDRPTLALGRVEPPVGPLESGRRFGFSVLARDDATVSAVRIEARGAYSFVRNLLLPPNGVFTNVVLDLPANTVAEGGVTITAVAVDDSGAASEEARLQYTLADATAPQVVLTAPLDGETLDPRVPLRLELAGQDNSRHLVWTVKLTGVLNGEHVIPWSLEPNVTAQQVLAIPLTNALGGGALTLESIVRDEAGNSIGETRRYSLRSVLGPRLTRVVAVDAGYQWEHPSTSAISVWSSVVLAFDRALDPRRSATSLLQVITRSGETPAHRVIVGSSFAEVTFLGPALTPGEPLAVKLLPGWVGTDGNPVTLADRSDLPASGVLFEFDVASVGGLTLTNGQPVVPGLSVLGGVQHESVPWPWTMALNGVPGLLWQVHAGGSHFLLTVPTNATVARVSARSVRGGREPLVLPEVELQVRPREGDDDRDGLPNGWEADHSWIGGVARFDPFSNADAPADFDGDRLDNLSEFRLGTEPFDPDTDHDGLLDGSESRSGGCPSPFDGDSDDDGISDRDDLAPCIAGESIALSPMSLTVPEGMATTNLLTASAAGLSLLSFDFAPESPRPAFASLVTFGTAGTNELSRQLVMRPSFDDAGTYELTLQVVARRVFALVTTNLTVTLVVEDRANDRFTRWARAVDGDWSVSTNWTAGLPGLGTNAVIDLAGSYAVRVTGNQVAESLRLGGTSGSPRLVVDGGVLDLNGASVVRPSARLSVAQFGRIRGPGSLLLEGSLVMNSGSLEGSGLVQVSPSASLEIPDSPNAQTITVSAPLVNRGTLRLGTNATLFLSGGRLTNEAGGRILQHRATIRGRFNDVMENRGSWMLRDVPAFSLQALRLIQKGRLEVEAGDLEIWGGQLEIAAGSTNRGVGLLTLTSVPARTAAPLDFTGGLRLSGSTLSNEVPQVFGRLELEQGGVAGAGSLVVTQQLVSNGGTLAGPGAFTLPFGASAHVMPFRSLVVERPVESDGHWLFDTNSFVLQARETFRSRGEMVLEGAVTWRANAGLDEGTLEILGTLRKRGTDHASFSGVSVLNRGRMTVESGILQVFTESSNAGRIEIADGATFEFQATMSHGPSSYLGGAGTITMGSGTHDLTGVFEPLGAWNIRSAEVRLRNPAPARARVSSTSGQVQLDQAQSFESWTIQHGEWQLGGDLTVTGAGSMSGGRLHGTGRLVVATNVVLSVAASSPTVEVDWINRGRIEMAPDTSVRFNGGRIVNFGDLNLAGGATFFGVGVSTNDFINVGTFRTATNAVRFSSVGFSALGRQILQPMVFSLDRGTNGSSWNMPAGGRTEFQNDFVHLPGSELSGAGEVDFSRGSQRIQGRMAAEGSLRFTGANVEFSAGFTNGAPVRISAGVVTLAGTNRWRDLALVSGRLVVSDRLGLGRALNWTGGTLEGPGRIRIEATATARPQGFGGQTLASSVEVAGVWSITNDTRISFRDGALTVLPGALHESTAAVSYWISGNASGRLVNEGALQKGGPGVFDLDLSTSGEGTWEVTGGRIDLGSGTQVGGSWAIGAGAELRLEGSTNRMTSGLTWSGAGGVTFNRSGTLHLDAETDFNQLRVTWAFACQILGEFVMRSRAGGSLVFNGTPISIEGAVEVGGTMDVGPSTVLRLDDALVLNSGATLSNQGRRDGQGRSNIRVRAFSNRGGTVSGIPPDVIPPSTPLLVVPRGGSLPGTFALRAALEAGGRGRDLVWWTPVSVEGRVQVSDDLSEWHDAGPIPPPDSQGLRRLRFESTDGPARFFRLRETDW